MGEGGFAPRNAGLSWATVDPEEATEPRARSGALTLRNHASPANKNVNLSSHPSNVHPRSVFGSFVFAATAAAS